MPGRTISIHAPREGGDAKWALMGNRYIISIHAPREGGDVRVLDYIGVRYYFNPRPPRGGRLQVDGQMEM